MNVCVSNHDQGGQRLQRIYLLLWESHQAQLQSSGALHLLALAHHIPRPDSPHKRRSVRAYFNQHLDPPYLRSYLLPLYRYIP